MISIYYMKYVYITDCIIKFIKSQKPNWVLLTMYYTCIKYLIR